MAFSNDEQSNDIFQSQAEIWNHIFSFIKPMSLKCAVQLQIPDIIDRHDAPMTLNQLVEALPINKEKSQFVYRLMRMLVHSGIFLKQKISESEDNGDKETEGYTLTSASRLLLSNNPLSLRPFLLTMLDPIILDPWQDMSTWLQNNKDVNPFQTTHGRTLWDYASQEPHLNHLFNEAMTSDSRLVMSAVEIYGDIFQGLSSIVDVGGGTGTVMKTIAKDFPDMRCISFDLPHVVDGLKGNKNFSYAVGDMFKAIPKTDAVLLKWILHDWSDEICIKILKRCKEAISKEGKVIIIDMVVGNHKMQKDKAFETQLFFDMLMMVDVVGKERNEKEWAKLFFDSGFSDYKITPALGLRSLIEIYP